MQTLMSSWMSSLFTRKNGLHVGIIVGFMLLALAFYYPLLGGKQLLQSDIRQYEGMARQLKEVRQEQGKELYWIENAFGGMPTYQLGAQYPLDVLAPLYKLIRVLPRPAHILFLYLLAAYCFLLVLRLPWHTALFGALGFGFSTYLLIILQVGHNTKALAIGYMPLVFAGLVLLYRKPKPFAFLLTTLALALQIRANHYQMTYYMLLFMGVYVMALAWHYFREKNNSAFLKSTLWLMLSGFLALGLNATPLLATAEYTAFSTRGKSDLNVSVDGNPKPKVSSGLDYDYITEYSYGIFESFNLIVPRIQGGGSTEDVGTDSALYDFLQQQGVAASQARQIVSNIPTYWGEQPILEAPAYIGITLFFFAFLGAFLVRGPTRNALVIGTLMSLFLSWGKNLPALTQFMIDYFPLYNKFRAVSSIQIVLEFCMPVLAALGLHALFTLPKTLWKKTVWLTAFPTALLLLLWLLKGSLSFQGLNDGYYQQIFGPTLFSFILEAREDFYSADLMRGILFSLGLMALVWAFLTQKIKPALFMTAVISLLLFDLLGVASRYIDRTLFVSPNASALRFQQTPTDQAILQDTTRYRVFEPQSGLTGARTAYFHNTIGGYHGAKPRRLQELYDYYTQHELRSVLDMLNVKYFIFQDSTGLYPSRNGSVSGPVWLVDSLKVVPNADAALAGFKTLNPKTTALVEQNDFNPPIPLNFQTDSTNVILLTSAKVDQLRYSANLKQEQFAVFSEMYYPHGWQLTIDQKPHPIYRVNYVLRGALLPPGEHLIEFKFKPEVVQQGTLLRGVSLLLFLVIVLSWGWREQKAAV